MEARKQRALAREQFEAAKAQFSAAAQAAFRGEPNAESMAADALRALELARMQLRETEG